MRNLNPWNPMNIDMKRHTYLNSINYKYHHLDTGWSCMDYYLFEVNKKMLKQKRIKEKRNKINTKLTLCSTKWTSTRALWHIVIQHTRTTIPTFQITQSFFFNFINLILNYSFKIDLKNTNYTLSTKWPRKTCLTCAWEWACICIGQTNATIQTWIRLTWWSVFCI